MSFKNKSRVITLVSGLVTSLSILTSDQIAAFLPGKFQAVAPIIVAVLGFLAAQLSEEKRIEVAEDLKEQEILEAEC